MKLALVGDLTGRRLTGAAGGEHYDAGSLARALMQRGQDVALFTAARDVSDTSVPVTRIPLDGWPFESPEALLPVINEMGAHLVAAWSTEPPDVVHCHGWAYGLAAQLAAKRCGVPTVQTFHGLSSSMRRAYGAATVSDRPDGGMSETAVKLETLLARNATAVTTSSTDDLGEVVRLGCPRARVSVVPHGIDIGGDIGSLVRRDSGAPTRVVAVARDLSPRHGVDSVVRALTALPSTDLVVIATGPDTQGGGGERVRALADTLRLANRVTVVSGVGDDGLTEQFQTADVVVFPAPYEPSLTAILRAMACAVPIVAASAGAPPDAVIPDITGVLVAPGQPDALRRALRTVVSQSVLRQGMGLAGRSRARSRYSWDRVATDAEVAYRHAVTHGQRLAGIR